MTTDRQDNIIQNKDMINQSSSHTHTHTHTYTHVVTIQKYISELMFIAVSLLFPSR
jgi:hypothetical protein